MEAGSRKYIEVKVLYAATRITNWFTFLEIRLDKLKVKSWDCFHYRNSSEEALVPFQSIKIENFWHCTELAHKNFNRQK